MLVDITRAVEWNGNILNGWVKIGGIPTKVTADRATIHRHAPGFNDAVTWEIERHRSKYLRNCCLISS